MHSKSASDYNLSCCYRLPLAKCKESSLYGSPFEVTAASGIPLALQFFFFLNPLFRRKNPGMCVHIVSEVSLSFVPVCLSIYIHIQGCLVQRWVSWLRGRTCLAEEFLQWNVHKTWNISREIFRDASKPTLLPQEREKCRDLSMKKYPLC